MDPTKWRLYESALIKSIRRGLVEDSVYWECLLYKLDKVDVVWRRLFIHLSEDIGIADRNLPANVSALFNNFQYLSEVGNASFEASDSRRLPMIHAIMLCATAEKSRAADNALVVNFSNPPDREVPDYCYDFHSPLGRRMGRDAEHFLNEAAHIENSSAIEDLWKDAAFKIMTGKSK